MSLGFELLVEQSQQCENITVGSWNLGMGIFLYFQILSSN